MELLLNNGADVNKADAGGNTALHVVARTAFLTIAVLLIDRGANTSLRNNAPGGGQTAMEVAHGVRNFSFVSVIGRYLGNEVGVANAPPYSLAYNPLDPKAAEALLSSLTATSTAAEPPRASTATAVLSSSLRQQQQQAAPASAAGHHSKSGGRARTAGSGGSVVVRIRPKQQGGRTPHPPPPQAGSQPPQPGEQSAEGGEAGMQGSAEVMELTTGDGASRTRQEGEDEGAGSELHLGDSVSALSFEESTTGEAAAGQL